MKLAFEVLGQREEVPPDLDGCSEHTYVFMHANVACERGCVRAADVVRGFRVDVAVVTPAFVLRL